MATLPCTVDNPCCCINVVNAATTTPPSPCPSDGDCCLRACDAILDCTDAVGPCGQSGTFDLTSLPHITTGCTGTIQYQFISQDGFFADVSISKAGIVTWVTGGPETVGKYGSIQYRITCQADCDDCQTLDSIGQIDIGVNDLCRNVVCDEDCEVCDPCTGNCIEEDINISIEET